MSSPHPSRENLTRLHIFGRPTKLATDDVSGPAACVAFLRITWLLVLSVAYSCVVYLQDSTTLLVQDCDQTDSPLLFTFENDTTSIFRSTVFQNEANTYLISCMALLGSVIVCTLVVRVLGRRGTILDYEKRAGVPAVIHVFVALVSLELGLATYGAMLVEKFDASVDLAAGELAILGCDPYDESQGFDSLAGIVYMNMVRASQIKCIFISVCAI
jgi:hypothetical protein